MKAYLILENGRVFCGEAFGAVKEQDGEIVFSTSMGSYIEALTDPAYDGQILVQTYPLIGNYGMIDSDTESSKVHVKGYIVREICQTPSNFRTNGTLQDFLKEQDVMGICGVDTREITKIIREEGIMKARITVNEPSLPVSFDNFEEARISSVSTKEKYTVNENGALKIALLDLGTTKSAIDNFVQRGASVSVLPFDTPASEILSYDALYISDGPGNPKNCKDIISTVKELFGKMPIFATGLGHQILALAAGGDCDRLKYGHHGANQPVKQLSSGRVYITAQNHNYYVVSSSLPSFATVTYENLNDKSCEGITYEDKNAFSVQFRPIEGKGPNETGFMFDKFFEMTGGNANA